MDFAPDLDGSERLIAMVGMRTDVGIRWITPSVTHTFCRGPFFFTYTAQPHLDGRYTAFGEVTSGMEVVGALLEGDVILEVRAEP